MNRFTVAIFSDVHFDNEHKGAWQAFRQWHEDTKPEMTVALGDIVDLGMLSTYAQEADSQPYAIEQIRVASKELNALRKETQRLVYVPGNHGERWERSLYGDKALKLRGAVGLGLKDQFYAQGLSTRVEWLAEGPTVPGLWIGRKAILCRHGHKQAGKYGSVHQAAKQLRETPTVSTIVGHHHRGQLMTQTILGKTVYAICNPHLSGEHSYNPSPNWQRGFTILEFYGRSRLRDCETFTPHLVLMDEDGRFSYGGKVYG